MGVESMLGQINVRIEETKLNQLKKVCELSGIKQSDFINMAIENAIEQLINEKAGGIMLKLPSPYLNQPLSEESKKEILDLMNETNYKFSKLAGGKLDVGLNMIKQFVEESFRKDSKEIQSFQETFEKYLNTFQEE